ncbi:hypothetical protein ACQPV1_08665 [Clostridium neonatale]|uniref:hypothetical protein n=1 Tax=Clostridium neonatale TaxID=137838 RepID=UPI003D34DEEA
MARVNKEQLKELKVGEKYTYKKMCNMGIFDSYTDGNGKKAQFEEFNQLVNYEKLPRGVFLIKEININVEVEEKTTGRKSVYAESLKPQLINALSQVINEKGQILVSKNALFEKVGLIGKDFKYYKIHRKRLWEIDNIPYSIQNKFFNGTMTKCESAIKTALKELSMECLIDFSTDVLIVKPLFEETRTATVEERRKIKRLEKEVAKSMGRKDLKDVFLNNDMGKFFDKLKPCLADELKIDFYFKGFDIVATSEFTEMLLSFKELNELREKVNKLMCKSIDTSSKKTRTKALKEIKELEAKTEKTIGRLKKEDKERLEELYYGEGSDNYFDFIDKLKEKCMTLEKLDSDTLK